MVRVEVNDESILLAVATATVGAHIGARLAVRVYVAFVLTVHHKPPVTHLAQEWTEACLLLGGTRLHHAPTGPVQRTELVWYTKEEML